MNKKINILAKNIRNKLQEKETTCLSQYATLSSSSRGRSLRSFVKEDDEDEFRLCYQRDRDKIIHSKPFRRLKGKAQVFLSLKGDHYRTRLTHTLEVSQISRTIARSLDLNEDLAEAVALGHDLGHTPFGHFGERSLNKVVPGGFHHARQSERIAKRMNLTLEVCDGVAEHSKGKGPILNDDVSKFTKTLEGQIVRVSDIIAYVNHDIDDAIRAGIINRQDIPPRIVAVVGSSSKENITAMISDLIFNTHEQMEKDFPTGIKRIYMSEELICTLEDLRKFLFTHVYENKKVGEELAVVMDVCTSLYGFFVSNPEKLKKAIGLNTLYDTIENVACDYVSGMTDGFAVNCYRTIFGK